ncbi:MAG: DUF2029 domain-containing protein [Crenarchaeota archaeon]|nr:DUF2029 domain-containing protein [Thermoproteota archaeon]
MSTLIALLEFVILLLITYVLYIGAFKINDTRYIKLAIIVMLVIFLGIMLFYIVKYDIIESRYDIPYFVNTAKRFVHLQNPYIGRYFCAYGPALPILIIPLSIFSKGELLVIVIELYLLALLVMCYYVLRKLGLPRLYAFFTCLLLGVNPMLNYWGVGLAQIDDLLCAIMVVVLLAFLIRPKSNTNSLSNSFISGLITGFAASVKIYLSIVGLPVFLIYLKNKDRRSGIVYLLSAIACFLCLNTLFYFIYGKPFLFHAYLEHTERVSGISLSSFLFNIGVPRSYTDIIDVLMLIALLAYLYMRKKITDHPVLSVRRALASLFAFLPLLYPVYLIPLVSVSVLGIAPRTKFYGLREKILIYSLLTILGLVGRLYQYYVVEGYVLSINAILSTITFLSLISLAII